jgi:hypothetical protein
MLLDRLRAHTGQLTVTLTAAGDDLPRVRDALTTTVGNLLRDAETAIGSHEDLDREERARFLEQLPTAEDLAARIPPRHGVWLAVSADLGQTLVPLSPGVRVTDQLVVDHRAALLRPLLEHEQQPRELLVLTLSDDASDLAVLDLADRELTSVGDPFPFAFGGDASGVQARDAGSRQRDERRRHHWRRVAASAHEVVTARDLPVVTVGVERNQAFLREVSAWPEELSVPVVASPDALSRAELIDRVVEAAEDHLDRRVADVRRLVADRTDAGRVTRGLTDLHAAAVAGRVELLVLVDGPPMSGYLTETGHLVAQDPGDATPVPDVYALGVAEVGRRGGEVFLAPEGAFDAPLATLRW